MPSGMGTRSPDQQQTLDVGPTEVALGELQVAEAAQPSSISETTTVPVQAGPKMALTSAYDWAEGWQSTVVDLGDGSAEVGDEIGKLIEWIVRRCSIQIALTSEGPSNPGGTYSAIVVGYTCGGDLGTVPRLPAELRGDGVQRRGGRHDGEGAPNYNAEEESTGLPEPKARMGDEAPGLLRTWWGGRTRSQTPPPKRPTAEPAGSPTLDVLTKGMQQLQELQAQALAKGAGATTNAEILKPGTMALAPLPDLKGGCEAALSFQDWLEVSSSVLGDVSEQSSQWWKAVVHVVNDTYDRWLRATPLERLAIAPDGADELSTGKWARLNARVASMLLAAMTTDLRGEMVTQRISQNVVRMVYRLHTMYQPGGSAERSDVLVRLQAPRDYLSADSLEEVLKLVRSWPRLLARCRAVNMSPPDPSVLVRGLSGLTDKYINQSPDAAFRTSMLRTSLRLDAQPSMESVLGYQRHLQAELETMSASTSMSSTAVSGPRVKAVDALQPKAKDGAARAPTGAATELCRYFTKASGCRRGDRCTYSHSMSGLDREQRAKKCLRCGSESHRQRECTVGKPAAKGAGSPGGKGGRDAAGNREPTSQQSTMASMATTASSTSSTGDPTPGVPWTLEALMQAAQQVVQQGTEPPSDGSPEKTRPTIKTLRLMDIRVCSMEAAATALLDSGATHSLRSAANAQEWLEAEEVAVQLAGNHHLTMRITTSGTLLMPRQEDREGKERLAIKAQTIVPMGKLIETLGYTMVWSPDECTLQSPEGRRIPLQVTGGCPQMCEMEALSLIARMEDRKLERLENETLTTRDKVGLSAMAMERHWNHYLYDYVGKGSFESGLRAVRDAPFFEDLPGECISGLIPGAGLENGWEIFKLNGFLTRPQRRKLMGSKRWVVHLFAGKEGHWELMQLDQGETSVVELDLARCSGHSILRDEVWRMLLWGAKHGKVDVVLGGPPGRLHQHCNGGERDVNSLKLIARMMWLYAVAQAGRELNASGINVDRDVAFVIEYPEGFLASQRQAREQEIQRAEDASRVPGRGQGASWEQTRRYWEQVQRPRWEDQVGRSTLNGDVAFWDTRMWKAFQRELEMRTVSFDQGAMGGSARNCTTLGTNVNSLIALNEVRLPEDDPAPLHGDRDYIWAPGLVRAIKVALSGWERHPQCAPRLCAMTAEQWKTHVRTNHAVYRKDCATCVMSRGLGRQHRRIHHPEAYVLTADVAGPLSPGLDATSKGALGKGLRYLLIGKYLVPKQFIEECFGSSASLDSSTEQAPEALPLTEEQQRDMEELFGESEVRDLPLPEVPQVEVIGIARDERDDVEISEEVAECDDQEPVPEEEPAEEEVERPSDVVMEHGDCVAPEMTFLTFAVALSNNQSATVKRGVQDMVLYLQNHGFPIYRFHADKGEFYNHGFRNWLRDQGVYGTWSEPSVPQGNGQAESTVRWIKDRTRTLLRASGLPMRLWPTAAATAAAEQRAKVLGWKSQLAAPYGAPVHLRKKGFDKAGPLRRELGLESKWLVGKYVGLSSIVHNGHLVYVPQDGDEKEKFLHTMHVRANLVDPGAPDDDLYITTPPKPRRRVTEKTDPKDVQMQAMAMTSDEIKELATTKAKEITNDWSLVQAMDLVEKLAGGGFFEHRKFGVYRHGGTVGWLSSVEEFPDLTKLLTKIVLEINPEATFTSVLVSHNTPRTMHKDFNNDYATKNVVVPIRCPDQGGELWIELKAGDVVHGTIEQRSNGKQMLFGQMLPLVQGESIEFGPQRFHETSPWKGNRVVIIGYTPNCLGKLGQQDLEALHDHGFAVPLSQLPEFHGDLSTGDVIRAAAVETPQHGQEESDDSPWSMYLQLEEGTVKIADAVEEENIDPRLNKVEVNYTPKIEEVLSQLTGPLDVTHAVSPDEVLANLEAWRPSILKELAGIEGAIERLPPGSEARRRWLGNPKIQRLPMKFVFTVKPNDKAVVEDKSTWFKRKSRLVICGNFAVNESSADRADDLE
ncbi:ycf43 [Symbiodinium sp. CCMP2456]|nr:ycf43 [Symbiodinium sp. CCMP2456]